MGQSHRPDVLGRYEHGDERGAVDIDHLAVDARADSFHKALARGMFIRATEPSRHTTIEHVNAGCRPPRVATLVSSRRYSRALGVATASSSMSQTDSAPAASAAFMPTAKPRAPP